MKQITKLEDLIEFLPELKLIYKNLGDRWDLDTTESEFINKLVGKFTNSVKVYGELVEGKILYFAVLEKETETKAYWWFIYSNPKYKTKTTELVNNVITELKREGVEEIMFSTTRLTSSYRRWVSKFKARPFALIYKIKL